MSYKSCIATKEAGVATLCDGNAIFNRCATIAAKISLRIFGLPLSRYFALILITIYIHKSFRGPTKVAWEIT